MRARVCTTTIAALVCTLALAGCGGSSTGVVVAFKSRAVVDGSLSAVYTCAGRDISPPLEWGAVPSVTTQLAVFILGLTPNPATHKSKVSIEWVIAGIDPALHRIPAGRLPPDTQVGRASDGRTRYSICPARGHSKRYQFALYGVPDSITTTPGFSGLELLREIANPNSTTEASVTGGFRASYTRRST